MGNERCRVVVVGGGFAGLEVARGLRREHVDITLVDRTNHHLFQPLLYQVATAGLAPSDIAEPIRSILSRQDNVTVRLAEVTDVDLGAREVVVETPDGDAERLPYDRLVLAAGASHSYFGNDEWEAHAPGLKTLPDALQLRQRLLAAFEKADWETDPEEREALMTFVVVGGGPTGVEMAGAISEIACRTLRKDYRTINTTKARTLLLEGGDAVLGSYPESLRKSALRQLESLNVEVQLNAQVTGVTEDGVYVGETFIPARTVMWAAGVAASPLAKTLGVDLDRAGRVEVEPDLSVPGHPEVFVNGDLAVVRDPETGEQVPGVAQGAIQMGQHTAKSIAGDLRGKERKPFRYFDKGNMATIGRSRAVADVMGVRLSGFFAWILWVVVHVLFLVSFRNRLLVMTKWAWAWFTHDRATRLVWPLAGPKKTGGTAVPYPDSERAKSA
ncbi:MAG: NAD(P)/FAD-dependent oxidoreductase [Myxococcota bacterium]